MRKTASTIALSIILLGAISPTSSVIASSTSDTTIPPSSSKLTKTNKDEAPVSSSDSSSETQPTSSISSNDVVNQDSHTNTSNSVSSSQSETNDVIETDTSSLNDEDINNWMPDQNLQAAVAKALGVEINELTKENVAILGTTSPYIYLNASGVSSLKGLEYVTGGTSFAINITNGTVSDLSPLTGVTMAQLNINNNNVSDLSPLRGKNLDSFLADDNNISDISPLNFSRLSQISLDNNHISNIRVIPSSVGMVVARNQTITNLPIPRTTDPLIDTVSTVANYDISTQNITNISDNGIFTQGTSPNDNTGTIEWKNLDSTLPNVSYSFDREYDFTIDSNKTNKVYFSGTVVQPFSDPVLAGNVTVKYQDTSGAEIASSEILTGNIGETYNSTQKDIPEYNFVEVRGSASGTFTDQPQEVIYVYSKDQTAVNVHNSSIYVGDEWKPEENFDNATNIDGTTLDYAGFIAAGGVVDDSQLDTNTPGTYSITYTLNGVTATANITVKDKQTAVNVHNSTIYVGDDWTAQDNFDSAIDKDGNPIDFSQVTVDDSQADTSKAGTFDVTYTYDGVTSTATVTVKDEQTGVNVHNSTIYVGDDWTAQDNFDSALDKDGNSVDFSQVTVDDSKADTSKPGTFDVTYTYDGVTSKATVTVKDKVSPKPTPEIPKDDGKNTDLPKNNNNETSSTSGKTVAHKNNDKVSEHKSRKFLPQTGASNGVYLMSFGLAVLVGIVLTFSLKNKPRRK